MTLYKQLFKLNSDDVTVQLWEIYHSNDSYWTVSGQVKGKKITSKPTLVIPKVKRSLEEQLKLEMDSLIKKKRDKKYVDNIRDVQQADSELGGYSPMLAKKWEDHKEKIKFPCAIQPKLDGVRCLITAEGMFSRNRQQYTSCQHIWQELQSFFKKYPDAQLDGELYSHEYRNDFEEIISSVRKTADKATKKDLERQKKISYYVYDCPTIGKLNQSCSFKQRFDEVSRCLNGLEYVTILQTEFGIQSEGVINGWQIHFVENGFEGAMVRNTNMPYEGKRTSNLLKVKTFQDDEFEIIGVNEGVGSLVGHAGTFTVKMNDGKTFNAKLIGKIERLKWIFENPSEVIGKMATIKYFNLTKYGIPRSAVAKSVRGLKDRSDWL